MSNPAPDTTGFQWLINVAGGIIALLVSGYMALLQIQLGWLRGDAQNGETRSRNELADFRAALDLRDAERARIQAERHHENQTQQAETRDAVNRRNSEDALERHRVLDHLSLMNGRIAALPDRAEVKDLIAAAIRSNNG